MLILIVFFSQNVVFRSFPMLNERGRKSFKAFSLNVLFIKLITVILGVEMPQCKYPLQNLNAVFL